MEQSEVCLSIAIIDIGAALQDFRHQSVKVILLDKRKLFMSGPCTMVQNLIP